MRRFAVSIFYNPRGKNRKEKKMGVLWFECDRIAELIVVIFLPLREI